MGAVSEARAADEFDVEEDSCASSVHSDDELEENGARLQLAAFLGSGLVAGAVCEEEDESEEDEATTFLFVM